MLGLSEKTMTQLEKLAEDLRELISRGSHDSRPALGDVEWELEKRRWREDAQPNSGKVSKDDAGPP